MRQYTVMVSWLVHGKKNYLRRGKTFHNVIAASCTEAGKLCTDTLKDKMNVSVNCVWYN